ncbi:MAG TPA: hypothetical protein VGD37_25260 [Kofleriaceae bacterium]|jgi:hypothetical protein
MRRSLVVTVMLASGSTVRSEPAPDPSRAYVELGAAAVGGTELYAAVSIESGYRPGPYGLWLHAVFQQGNIAGPFASQEGSDDAITSSGHLAVRVGIDKRICLEGHVWCAIAGVDAGYLHQYAISRANPKDLRGPVVVPHLGLDFGGHVRFRPGIEANVAHGVETVGLTAAIAYLW